MNQTELSTNLINESKKKKAKAGREEAAKRLAAKMSN